MGLKKFASWMLFVIAVALLLTPYLVSKDLLFPFITSKAFYLRILVEIAFPAYVFLLLVEPKARPSMKNWLNVSVLAFLVVNFVSAFAGVNVTRAIWGNFERMGGAYYLLHLTLVYFYVLALGQISSKYMLWFLKAMVISSSILAFYGWMVKWGFAFITDPSMPSRVSTTFGNPIFYASYLLIPMFLAAFFAFQAESKESKIWYWFLALLQLSAIFLSGTRGALIGLIVGFGIAGIFFVLKHESQRIRNYGSGVLGVGLIVVVLVFMFPQRLPQAFSSRIFNLNDSNTKARFIQWKTALEGFKERPILGTGPENYYYIANKYYNPELRKYDPSWFDKPHNYILEILVTNGVIGFIPYLGMLIFSIWALYRGFKTGFLTLTEFCLLLAGFLAYQVQNLFVFDTVAASFMFFASLAFWSYIQESSADPIPTIKGSKVKQGGMDQGFAIASTLVVAIVSIYAIWLTNFEPMSVAKAVNYGYGYTNVQKEVARQYFAGYLDAPFKFDPGESASKYADFVTAEVQSATTTPAREQARADLDQAQAQLANVLQTQGTYPIYWQKLATIYLAEDMLDQQVRGDAEDAIKKAIALAPNRIEARTFYAQIKAVHNNIPGAIDVLLESHKTLPNVPEINIQLAYYYDLLGDSDNAKKYTDEALALNYKYRNFSDMQGIVHYYEKQKDYGKLVELMEQAAKLEPNNVNIRVDLLKSYILHGNKQQAQDLAAAIIKYAPEKTQEVQQLMAALK